MQANCILVYDTFKEKLYGIDTKSIYGINNDFPKWANGVEMNGKIYAVPLCADCILVYDVSTNDLRGISTENIRLTRAAALSRDRFLPKWSRTLEMNGKIIGIPHAHDKLLVYDIENRRLSEIHLSGIRFPINIPSLKVDTKLYIMPHFGSPLIIYDGVTEEVKYIRPPRGFDWVSPVESGGKIYAMPGTNEDGMLVFDIDSGVFSSLDISKFGSYWIGACLG